MGKKSAKKKLNSANPSGENTPLSNPRGTPKRGGKNTPAQVSHTPSNTQSGKKKRKKNNSVSKSTPNSSNNNAFKTPKSKVSTARYTHTSGERKAPETRFLPAEYKYEKEEDMEISSAEEDPTANEEATGFITLTPGKSHEQTTPSTSTPVESVNDGFGTDEDVPWMRRGGYRNRNVFLRLHEEIMDFVKFLSPTEAERDERKKFTVELENLVAEVFPEATMTVFGSSATQMYMPHSDVDVVLLNAPESTDALFDLADALREKDLVDFIEVVDKARVPIVKFVHKGTGINVDVCFNQESGLETAKLVKEFVMKYPPFRPMVLFLKYFLHQRGLNETYSGGIGSFLLQIMVLSTIQQYTRLPENSYIRSNMMNLGHLIYFFFELYGSQLNYKEVGISVLEDGEYFRKYNRYWLDPARPHLLSVENPNNPEIDIAKNSYDIRKVKRAFEYANMVLKSEIIIRNNHRTHNPSASSSILKSIINVDDELYKRKGPSEFGFNLVDPKEARELTKNADRGRYYSSHHKRSQRDFSRNHHSKTPSPRFGSGNGRNKKRLYKQFLNE